MDQMEDNEIEIESVNVETNTDSSIPITPPSTNGSEEKAEKLVRFPLTRVKHLVKMDPDVHLCSNEALFLLTKATELFVECISKEAYSYTSQSKKKTVQKRDVDQSVEAIDCFAFLEGVLDS